MDTKSKMKNNLIRKIQKLSADKLAEITSQLNKFDNPLQSKDITLKLAGTWKDMDNGLFADLTANLHGNRLKDRQID